MEYHAQNQIIEIDENLLNKFRKFENHEIADCILNLVFFRYISFVEEKLMKNHINNEKVSFHDAYSDDEINVDLENLALEKLGYFIKPEYLFNKENFENNYHKDNLRLIKEAFNQFYSSTMGQKSRNLFKNIFDNFYSENSSKLQDDEASFSKIIQVVLDCKFICWGVSFEYLLNEFFYKSENINTDYFWLTLKLIAESFEINKKNFNNILNPNCSNLSQFINIGKSVEAKNYFAYFSSNDFFKVSENRFYGQTTDEDLLKYIKMDFIINNLNYDCINVLTKNSKKKFNQQFDAIIYNSLPKKMRINSPLIDMYSTMNFIENLNDDGVMALTVHESVLYKNGPEADFRTDIIERNMLDAIIALPPLFNRLQPDSEIIFIINKNKTSKDIFFVNSNNYKIDNKNNNRKRTHNYEIIDLIINLYKNREDLDGFSRKVDIFEIKQNGYNLNMSRYINNFEAEKISLSEVILKEKEIDKELKEIDLKISRICKNLKINYK